MDGATVLGTNVHLIVLEEYVSLEVLARLELGLAKLTGVVLAHSLPNVRRILRSAPLDVPVQLPQHALIGVALGADESTGGGGRDFLFALLYDPLREARLGDGGGIIIYFGRHVKSITLSADA